MRIKYFTRFCILLLFLLSLNNCFYSQNSKNNITIEDLVSPVTPAFILMGISPKEIEKPQTPKEFGVMLSNLIKGGDPIPKNLSLEFTPYWLVSHPNLNFNAFSKPGIFQSMMQTFAISLATTPIDSATNGTTIGLGFHTVIIPGRLNKDAQTKYDAYKTKLKDQDSYILDKEQIFDFLKSATSVQKADSILKSIRLTFIEKDSVGRLTVDDFNDKIDSLDPSLSPQLFRKSLDAMEQAFLEQDEPIKILVSELRKIGNKKTGFQLDLAMAVTGNSKNDSLQIGKLGIWITPNYSFDNIDLLTTVRFIHDDFSTNTNNMGDLGLRIIFSSSNFNFSIEALGRFMNKNKPKDKYLLNIDYKINDNSYFTASFGKDFDSSSLTSKGNLVSILGINFGLGKDPIVKP